MKKNGILNSEIARVLAGMGHTDTICIGDCGLPVPEHVEKIDLAVKLGSPTFLEVFAEVLADFQVEKIVLAEEIKEQNQQVYAGIGTLAQELDANFETEFVNHEQFKQQSRNCKAVIRTGEITPYANIILQSGCIF